MSEEIVRNQETDPRYNTEPGLAVVYGSAYQREMRKFEQFPYSQWAGGDPGNPYVYRPFPKMLYKAERYNGAVVCMAAPPDSHDFTDNRAYERAQEAARRFTEKCQRVVNDEREYARAREEGWQESPQEAVEHVHRRDAAVSEAAAHRAYEDRNMSPAAKEEIAAVEAKTDDHVAEVPQKRRPGRPRKVQPVT